MTSMLTKKYNFDAVYDSQKVYRLILEAMSHPGRVVPMGGYTLLSVAMTLLDNEVSFHLCGDDALADEIASLTLAGREPLETADFIFVCKPEYIKDAIEKAKCGTLADPHKSATVIIQDDGEPDCRLTFSGPGIDGNIEAHATQTVKDAIIIRDEQHYEYPRGIDLIFISSNGELFAIPRLVKVVQ